MTGGEAHTGPPAVERLLGHRPERPGAGTAQDAREATETLLRAVVEQSTDMIFVITFDAIVFANARATEVLGVDLVGRSPQVLTPFVHDEDLPAAAERFHEVFTKPGSYGAIEMRLSSDDEWRSFEVAATNLTDEPAIGGVLFSARDVTERRRAHERLLEQERRTHALAIRRQEERVAEQLRRARQMDTVGRLAAGAAHDFGNLLGVVANCTVAVQRALGSDHPAQADLEYIEDAVARASDLIQQLLLFGSPTTPVAERFDLRCVVDDAAAMSTAAAPAVPITRVLPREPLDVVGDRWRIERALMNVLVNARDAMPDGGHVRMRAERVYVTARPATTLGVEPGAYARLTVRDDGPGMAPEVLERAFEPFFTTSAPKGGTGLGLSTAKDAVERAGGAMSLQSQPGAGTTATILLPLAPLERAAGPGADGPRQENGR